MLNLVWERLLPSMQDEILPDDRESYERLAGKLASLSLDLPQGNAHSSLAKQVSGRTFRFDRH